MAAPQPSSKSCVFSVAEHRKYRSRVSRVRTSWKVTGSLTVGLVWTPFWFWCTVSGKVHTVCTPLSVRWCEGVCVCACVHVYHFPFLQRKLNYVSSRHELFPVGMMKLCLACCLVKSMLKMGVWREGGRGGEGEMDDFSVPPPFSRC